MREGKRFFHFGRPSVERDVDDEVAFHFRMRVEQFIAEGMSPADAERAARAQFGDVAVVRSELVDIDRRAHRRRDWRETMHGVALDVVVAVRALRREPVFTVGVVVTLALGIGANATMFGIIDGLMLRGPAHVVDARRVNRLYISAVQEGAGVQTGSGVGYVTYAALRDRATSFAGVGAYRNASPVPYGTERDAPTIQVANVTWDLFTTLGVRPVVGRFFDRSEDSPPDGARVVVIGERLWRTEFAGDAGALGRRITLAGEAYTIIGVAPMGFTGPERVATDAWLPMSLVHPRTDWPITYRAQWLRVVARVKPGVAPERAGAEATRLLRAAYNGTDSSLYHLVASVRPLWFGPKGELTGVANVSRWLMGVAVIVLLITCANVANLMMARTRRRGREVAVRLALGAGGARVMRFILAETFVVALGGALLSLGVAAAGGRVMRATLLSRVAWDDAGIDHRVLLFTLGVTLATVIAVGVFPALDAARVSIARTLTAGDRASGRGRARLRVALSALQAALCVVLLIGAGLFVQSLYHSRHVNLGFQADRVIRVLPLTTPIAAQLTPEQKKAEAVRRRSDLVAMAERLRRVPEIEGASIAVGTPFGYAFGVELSVPGRDSIPQLEGGGPYINAVTAGYFATVGTPLRRGRVFTGDDRDGSAPVVIVNETMAKLVWPGEEPLGKCLIIGGAKVCSQVVGVVADAHRSGLRESATMQYYVPFGQERGIGGSVLLVRPRGDVTPVMPLIRRTVLEMPSVTGLRMETIQAAIDPEYGPWQLGAAMFGVFGGLALVIAAIGLYSVIAYLVADRTRELGVRIALGATGGRIVRDVVLSGVATVSLGIVVGVGVALAAGRFIEPMLFDVSSKNPTVIAAVAMIVLSIAVVAAWSPARRASRVDPVVALRAD